MFKKLTAKLQLTLKFKVQNELKTELLATKNDDDKSTAAEAEKQ